MKKTVTYLLLSASLIGLGACRGDFEKIRSSGDWMTQYQEALKYYAKKDYLKASTLLELVIPQLRGKKEAEDVYYKYAYCHFYLGKYILASHYFKNFAATFPNSTLREEVDYMSAYAQYMLSPSFRLDQKYTNDAIEGLQIFVNTYPTSERVKECNQLIDELRSKLETKAFAEGQLYFDLRQYQSAMQSFENLLKDFPETSNAEQVRYMIVKSSYMLAENSIYEKRADRLKNVVTRYNEFIVKYPKSKYKKELDAYRKDANKKLKSMPNV